MQDRVPAPGKANRVRIRTDDGQTIEGVFEYADDASVQGSYYNKENVLPDSTCETLELSTSAEPKDAFEHAALPEYSLRIGDLIGSERSLPSNFLTASGGTYSKSAYPDLYSLIGTTYGFGRSISRTLDIPSTTHSGDDGVFARLVCSKSGVFCIVYGLGKDSESYSHFAVGYLNSDGGKVLVQPQGAQYARATYDDEFVYVYFYQSGTGYIVKYGSDGEVARKTIPGCSYIENIDGDIYIADGTKLYKLNADDLSVSTVTTSLPGGAQYGFGKSGNYYFCSNYRGTSWGNMTLFSIPDESESINSIKQFPGFVLFYTTSKLYKTTDGENFVVILNNLTSNSDIRNDHFVFLNDGLHKFCNRLSAEVWYKTSPISITNAGIQATLSRKPIKRFTGEFRLASSMMNMESDDGYLIPYVKSDTSGGIGVQLVPKDFNFKLPTYNCGGKYLKIKAKKTGV